MATYEITSPDGQVYEVTAPDDASEEQVLTYARSQFGKAEAPQMAPAPQAQPEQRKPTIMDNVRLAAGATPFGMAADAGLSMLESLVRAPVAGVAGAVEAAKGGYAGDVVEKVGTPLYQPQTPQGQALSSAMGYLPQKWAEMAHETGDQTAEESGSPLLGAAVNTGIQALPAILTKKLGTPNSSRAVVPGKGGSPSKAAPAPRQAGLGGVPPTVEELGAQASKAYKAASDAGANISPASFTNLKNRLNVTLNKEGLDPTLHPQTTAALKRVNGTKGAVSLDQLETLRKIANDARGGVNKADSRMASKIVDDIDDFMDGIGPKDITSGNPAGFAALKEARNLYSRKMKAEEISELVRRAEISAPNFSASGMENALRTEFRALAKNSKKMRRFTPEERAAITKVAKGGPMENALRMMGKFAPQGAVSTAISGGMGFMAGGPLGAVGLPAMGAASRYAATRMTKKNVRLAEETMRRGPPPKKPKSKNALRELEQAF